MVWFWLKFFGHECHDVGLRNRLVVTNRQRAVFIAGSARVRWDEFFSRHLGHRIKHAFVFDIARPQLLLDHEFALSCELRASRRLLAACGSGETGDHQPLPNSLHPDTFLVIPSEVEESLDRMSDERKTPEMREQMTDLERLRHSASHVLATAILKLWPDAQFAAGPPVENGFYYDVDLPHRISPDDFEKIEAEMKKEIKANHPFERMVVSRDEALSMANRGVLGALGERSSPSKFKLDIIQNIPEGEEISLYRNGDFTDLCAGPHVMRTGNIGAFKLTHVASAYYKGDEKNPQLQRIYGTAFKNKTQLDEYFAMLEEAKKRDHRKLGKELEIFVLDDDVGPGLPMFLPRGAAIVEELEKLAKETEFAARYQRVRTPHIARERLYRKSGHLPYYAESMFPPMVVRKDEEHRL